MYYDPSGTVPEWFKWFSLGGAIIGTVLVIGAITVLTAGVGTATLAGAIAVGASKGILIGAGIGMGLGTTVGVVGSLTSGQDFGSSTFWENIIYSAMAGFGIGAVVGGIIGGTVGNHSWYSARALEFTHTGTNNEVVLGNYIGESSHSYEAVALERNSTYFSANQSRWLEVQAMRGVGENGMWKINKVFLRQQKALNRTFVLSSDYLTFLLTREIGYLLGRNILPFLI